MNVVILKPFGKWKAGARPDLTRNFARQLIAQGIAKEADGSVEAIPKKDEDPPPQMTVNNYFFAPGTEPESEEE